MSGLSYLEKLLDGVEVEWKPLGKVLERTKGTKITAGQMKELHKDGAPIKIFAGGKTIVFVNFDDIPEKNINREPSIIVKSRGIIEFEYYDKPFSHKNEMWAYHSNNYAIHIKYIYYFMRVNESYFQQIASKMQMPQIATPDTDKFKVPIPCPDNPERSLAIQSEIVRILDAFTALTNELTNELKLRQKQYNYYREQLLSFDDGEVEWIDLDDVFDIFAGGDVPKDLFSDVQTKDFNIPILSNGIGNNSLYGWTNKAKIDLPSLTISARGTIGWTSYRTLPFFPVIRLLALTPKLTSKFQLNLKYSYYYMKTIEGDYRVPKTGIPQLTKPMLKGIRLPIPCPDDSAKSLAIQSEIV
ncbi:restriction endonuclease subunit S, partial [Salmonella enterica]|nr:restriction endonuclease subunit S [Salmonella enterica]